MQDFWTSGSPVGDEERVMAEVNTALAMFEEEKRFRRTSCQTCNGTGWIQVVFPAEVVSREMAIDAGDALQAGRIIPGREDYEPCPDCQGAARATPDTEASK
jgi:DnaJ-class molecular chaperone